MKALLLLAYALGAPIGVGCLLFLLWRLEEGVLGSPPPGPLPEGARPNPTISDEPATAIQPSLLYVGALRDPEQPAGELRTQADLGLNGYRQPAADEGPNPPPTGS